MKIFNKHEQFYKYIEHAPEKNTDYETRIIISNIYSFLEDYLNIANFQFERIDKRYEEMDKVSKYPSGDFRRRIPFLKFKGDVHFLLISIEKAYNLIMQLYMKFNIKSICLEVKNSDEHTNINRLRNKLEHMEENLDDDWNKSKNKMLDVFKSSVNWFAHDLRSYGDKTVKIGDYSLVLTPDSLTHLYSCYNDVTKLINDKYVIPDKDEIDKFWANFRKQT